MLSSFVILTTPRSPISTLFPYTTLFRSVAPENAANRNETLPASRTLQYDGGVRVKLWTTQLVVSRSEEHTSELQSHVNLVCRLLLEKKKWRQHLTVSCRDRPPRSQLRAS